MGVTGLTQNKLFRIKSLDPNDPYKVGYNGVLDVYNDDFGYTIVKYEIDDIIYKSYLPTTKPQNSIRDFTLNTSNTYSGSKNIAKLPSDGLNKIKLGNTTLKNNVGSVFTKKDILNSGPDNVLTKSVKNNNVIPVNYRTGLYGSNPVGDTIFETKTFSYAQFTTSGILKNEKYIGFIGSPKVESDLFIERDQYPIYERHQRLSEINNLAELFNYRNGYYTEINTI